MNSSSKGRGKDLGLWKRAESACILRSGVSRVKPFSLREGPLVGGASVY
jgi:hypothetical protein